MLIRAQVVSIVVNTPTARCVVTSGMLLDYVVLVVVNNSSLSAQGILIWAQVVSIVVN